MTYIVWDPNATIFDMGFFALRWYSLLFAFGFALGFLIIKGHYRKAGLPERSLERLVAFVVMGTLIGARVGHCLLYDFPYYSQHILEIFLPFEFEPRIRFVGYAGLASHGGAVGILIALFIYSRIYRVHLLWLLDRLALAVPLVGVFIRLGNLMNSEIIGTPSTHPWAFIFVQVDSVPRHPGQLYEVLAYAVIFILLHVLHRHRMWGNGFLFGVLLCLVFSARFAIEFLKADQSAFEAGMLLNMGQLLSIPFIVLGLTIAYRQQANATLREVEKF